MSLRIYLETTIPSYYFEQRAEAEIVARRQCTREWWSAARITHELVTSAIVLRELRAGPVDRRQAWLDLMREVPVLDYEPRVDEIVKTYLRHRLMPSDPNWDAYHLAFASYYECDVLVTWNCRHLANANKFGHIRKINRALGLFVPDILTPYDLLEKSR
jgi:predicted nucleic acid-binding protein